MTNWYYADRLRQQQGPVDGMQLARLFHDNALTLDSLVWRDGLPNWQPLRDFAGELSLLDVPPDPVAPPAPPSAQPAPNGAPVADAATAAVAPEDAPTTGRAVFEAQEPRQQIQRDADLASHSPYAAPTAAVASHSGVVSGCEVVYAGFWKRVAANIIDSFIVGVVGGVIGAIIGGVMGAGFGLNGGLGGGGLLAIQVVTNLVSLCLTAAYYAWFHASSHQATLGKMAIGIKVVRSNGEAISFLRGIGRYFATIISGITLGIGFVMAAFTARKQALHDMICDTLVVDRWAYTDHPEWQKQELGTLTIVILVIGGLFLVLGIALILFAVGMAASLGR
jgi:uncharacterized RDD family membrane protein YckC